MSYKEKYYKYKTLYLDLKQQDGGYDNKNVVITEEKKFTLPFEQEKIKKKIGEFGEKINQYKELVRCQHDVTDLEELKSILKETYATIGNDILKKFNIENVIK